MSPADAMVAARRAMRADAAWASPYYWGPSCCRGIFDTLSHMKSRREFVTGGLAASTFLNLNPRAMGANEKVTLALIGGRNQGKGDATRAIQAGAVIKTFCD